MYDECFCRNWPASANVLNWEVVLFIVPIYYWNFSRAFLNPSNYACGAGPRVNDYIVSCFLFHNNNNCAGIWINFR